MHCVTFLTDGMLTMKVLIVERDELVAEVLAKALTEHGISSATARDDTAAAVLSGPEAPHVVITSINRQQEDMAGLQMVRAWQRRSPLLRAVYLAALWPTRLRQRPRVCHRRARSPHARHDNDCD